MSNINNPDKNKDSDKNKSKTKDKSKRKYRKPKILLCDECQYEIDNINLYRIDYEDRIICNVCYYHLTNQFNPPHETPCKPPNQPPLPFPTMAPKVSLFFTTNTPFSNKNPDTNKHDDYDDNNDCNDDCNDDCNKHKNGDDDYDDDNTSTIGNNFGSIFFSSLMKRLDTVENKNKKSKTESSQNKKSFEQDPALEYEWLGDNIKSIDDLIEIGKTYNDRKRKRHNLNLHILNNLVEPLTELKNMIGMKDVKKIIFDQLIYYVQQLDDKNTEMLHTVITGPPGVGKTQLTHIIAKIYNRMGFLKSDKVVLAKRDDLIAEYVGQTAPKTRKILEKALGGVLLLDEVYSLTPTSERDFARESIDMINMYLSEHPHDLVCVVAGYKKPTYEQFFKQNEGLARRFTHHFEIKGYDAEELVLIFKKYLETHKWILEVSISDMVPIIEKNKDIFPNFGGDMTTLFGCCKKTHSKRLLSIPTEKELLDAKKKINITDITTGIELFKEIKEKHSSSEEEDKQKYINMYS